MPPFGGGGRKAFVAWQQKHLEEGHNHGADTAAAAAAAAAAPQDNSGISQLSYHQHDDDDKTDDTSWQSNEILSKVCTALLLLLAFIGFSTFGLSTAAMSCRMLDMQRGYSSDVNFIGYGNGNHSGARPSCYFVAPPISDLWLSKYWVILLVNFVSTLVMLQSLMLICQGSRGRDTQGPASSSLLESSTMLDNEMLEPCATHPQDFVLRLIYKTGCQDDVIVKTQPPMRSVGEERPHAATKSQQTKTQELLHSQARTNQLRQAAQVNREAYKVRLSLGADSMESDG